MDDADWSGRIAQWVANKEYERILSAWVAGADIDWRVLYPGALPTKLSLPTYPFEESRYWFDSDEANAVGSCIMLEADDRSTDFAFLTDDRYSFEEQSLMVVRRVLENVCGKKIPNDDMLFSDVGIESIQIVGFVDFWQALLGVKIQPVIFYGIHTVSELRNYLVQNDLLTAEGLIQASVVLNNEPSSPNKAFPLTDLQQSFIIGRKIKTCGSYVSSNIYFELDIKSNIAVAEIESAWNTLVSHHEALHTAINDDFTQLVLDQVPYYSIAASDVSFQKQLDQDRLLEKLRLELKFTEFDLGSWPYFDVRATQLKSNQLILHVAIDELVADAASVFVLVDQLRKLVTNPNYELPTTSYTFQNHVDLLKKIEHSQNFAESLGYWKEKLTDFPSAPKLGATGLTSSAREKVQCLSAELNPDLWSDLKCRAQSINCSPGAVLLAIFSEVLAEHTGQQEFAINLTNINRLALNRDVQSMVGLLANSNIFVASLGKSGDFQQLVEACQKQLDADASHSFVGAIRVIRELRKLKANKTDWSLPVVFTNITQSNFQFSTNDDEWRLREVMNTTPQVVLDHHVFEHEGALKYRWYVAAALAERPEFASLFSAYKTELLRRAGETENWRSTSTSESFPLTGLQKALAASRLLPPSLGGEGCVFHIEYDFKTFDLNMFSKIWNTMVRQHPILRTKIHGCDGQVVLDFVPHYKIENEAVCDGREFETRCSAIREELLQKIYKVGEYPNYSIRAVSLSDNKTRVFISLDFIVLDGNSISLLLAQLFRDYLGFASVLQAKTVSFKDILEKPRIGRSDSEIEASESYWKERISRLPKTPQKLFGEKLVGGQKRLRQYSTTVAWWGDLCRSAKSLQLRPESILLAVFGTTVLDWIVEKDSSCKEVAISVVHWDSAVQADSSCAGPFSRVSWISFMRGNQSIESRAREIQVQLDQDQRQLAVDSLNVLPKFRGISFPFVFTMPLDMQDIASALPKDISQVYAISRTPQVALDNIVSILSSETLRIQWDTCIPEEDLTHSVFERFCTRVHEWVLATTAYLKREQGGSASGLDQKAQTHVNVDEVLAN